MKVGIIVQARMGSTRLPQKVLLPLVDQPMLKYETDRLKNSGLPIFIATTTNPNDDVIVDFCKKEKLNYFRGSEDHVLERFYECAVLNELDIIVRLSADCPLTDGFLVKTSVERYIAAKDPFLYLSNSIERTFPVGFDFEIFSFQLLEEAYKNATLKGDIEHVTPYIHQKRAQKVNFQQIKQPINKSHYRMTIDTPEDYEMLKVLIGTYQAHLLNYQSIIDLFDKHPEISTINQHINQRKFG